MKVFMPLSWSVHPSAKVHIVSSWLWVPADIIHAKQEGPGAAWGPLPNLEWRWANASLKMPMPYPGTRGYGEGIFFLIAVDYYVTVDISCTCNFKNPKRKKVINQ